MTQRHAPMVVKEVVKEEVVVERRQRAPGGIAVAE